MFLVVRVDVAGCEIASARFSETVFSDCGRADVLLEDLLDLVSARVVVIEEVEESHGCLSCCWSLVRVNYLVYERGILVDYLWWTSRLI